MNNLIATWKAQLGVRSDTELAALLGLSSMAITHWKKGKNKPSAPTVKLIEILIIQKNKKDKKKGQSK